MSTTSNPVALTNGKHTSGPWTTKDGVIEAGERVIGNVLTGLDRAVDRVGSKREQVANARLIAASPDAHRILLHLMDFIEPGCRQIHTDSLMPSDEYDGATEDQTLDQAVRAYFKKIAG